MTKTPTGFTWTTLTARDRDEVNELDHWAFPTSLNPNDGRAHLDEFLYERSIALRDSQGQLAAQCFSYPFADCPTPGGRVAVAGLTWVAVHPGHRRHGLLRTMITAHLQACQSRGEPVSLLYASEPAIYGRFGFGEAGQHVHAKLARGQALRPLSPELAAQAGDISLRLETADEARHSDLIEQIHRAAGQVGGIPRPGWVTRDSAALRHLPFIDVPQGRDHREPRRILMVERQGRPSAYALFARDDRVWGAQPPPGTLYVDEAVGLDPVSYHALWERLLDFDLIQTVVSPTMAVDDPLFAMLVNAAATHPVTHDDLWARIIDLPAALMARRYLAGLDLVIEVSDDLLPDNAGRWHLSVEPAMERPDGGTVSHRPATEQTAGPATSDHGLVEASAADDTALTATGSPNELVGSSIRVERTTQPADLSLDIRQLGAIYLAGVSPAALAGAGLISGPAWAVAQLGAAFAWPVKPGTSWDF